MSVQRITGESGPWPLHDAAASRQAEAWALERGAPGALMQAAGLSLARLALAWQPQARRMLVLSGPGNNGGDGLVAASHLHRCGMAVEVLLLADPDRLPADAAGALQQARDAGIAVSLQWPPAHDPDLIIDALLGLGTSRAPAGAIAAAIEWMNQRECAVLAVDLPSGLHPDTGLPLGRWAAKAGATLSLLTLKPGLFTGAGRDHAGQVWFDDLGIEAASPTAMLCGRQDIALPRPHASHKGSYGDLAVIGGAPGMAGAAQLAASAALAAGAGRVYLARLDDEPGADLGGRPELMTRAQWWLSPASVLARSTAVCGCGGGERVRAALPALLSHAGQLVLDADALNAVAADSQLQSMLRARAGRDLATVLTPHPLEAAKLLQQCADAVQADRLAAAHRLAQRWSCVVLLKGSGSVVAAPDRTPTIIGTGNALLATAGTGDVLAGWLGGCWSQHRNAFLAAVESAWLHGHAADRAALAGQRRPLLAADLVRAMAQAAR